MKILFVVKALSISDPLGIMTLSAALKKEILSKSGYEEMISLTTKLNKPGVALSQLEGVHALTDVTGFGLAGHLLEMARGSKLMAQVDWSSIPVIQEAVEHVKADIFTGASTRNWAGYGNEVNLANNLGLWQRNLLTDPQTSGGLLIACAPEQEAEVLNILNADGFTSAKKIGHFAAGTGLSVA
jgi:selenide,water dikinase